MSDECTICGDCDSVSESSTDCSSDDWSGSEGSDDDYSSETESECSYCEREARNDDFKNYDDAGESDGKSDNSDANDDQNDYNEDDNDNYQFDGDGNKKYHRRRRYIENDDYDENNGSQDDKGKKYYRQRKNYEDDQKCDCEKDYNEGEKDTSGEENDGEGQITNNYKGFDGYPQEIQQFIKEKLNLSNENPTLDGPNDNPPNNNDQLEALLDSFGGMMKSPKNEDEEINNEALDAVLGDDKLEGDSEDDGTTLEGSHSRRKRHITRHGGGHHKSYHRNHGGHHTHHRRHGGHHRRHGGHGHHKSHRRRRRSIWRMTKIVCPTGKSFAFTMPAKDKTGWKCGKKSKLITLHKNGRMGRREYTIVSKELDISKTDHNVGKFSKYDVLKIQKIVNPCLWKRYRYRRRQIIAENGSANDRLLWHGSKHVTELVDQGFDERHANPKGMFGAGLYFATNSSKSNQYVHLGGCPTHKDAACKLCERKLLLCRVSLGRVMQYTTAHNLAHAPVGYHSVEGVPGGALKYSENIVYRGEQVYPEFLITYKLVP